MKNTRLLALTVGVCSLAGLTGWSKHDPAPRVPARAAVGVYVLGPERLVVGSRAAYRIAVHWASSPRRAGPLPGAEVAVSMMRKGTELALGRGVTDDGGGVHLTFKVPRVKTGESSVQIKVSSRLGTARREHKVSVFPGGKIMLTTDKKLYQPGQVIHIRALALRSMDLRPVARRPVQILVKDPRGTVVYTKGGQTSRFGIASLDFQLADEINLGSYTIEAWTRGGGKEGLTRNTVQVKRYSLPKYKVQIETPRAYYAPGEKIRGKVRCNYFFGKPVANARTHVTVSERRGNTVVKTRIPDLRTDAEGNLDFEFNPGGGSSTQEQLQIVAEVVDGAGQRERSDHSLLITSAPLTLEVVPESAELVKGVKNKIHVLAGYPDGKPAVNTDIKLWVAGRARSARTNHLGVASFAVYPAHSPDNCSELEDGEGNRQPGMAMKIQARDRLGERATLAACAVIGAPGKPLVRPTRSLVMAGEQISLDIFASSAGPFADRRVHLDVVKAGQTLSTYSANLKRGRARFIFQPDAALFGMLELRGYRIATTGERVGQSRMIYVDHPGKLKIKATTDRGVYRPGQRARVRFQVSDSRTGDGVQAALGILAVDEAAVALGGLDRRSPKLFFTLTSQVFGDGIDLIHSPGGKDLNGWIEAEGAQGRAAAAAVLLAAVQPAKAPVWETNPWKDRREAWSAQAPRLIIAAKAFMRDHSVGRRTARGWRFRRDLVSRMIQARAVKRGELRDPWRRVVRPWHLRETDKSFAFAPLASRIGPVKLVAIYQVLEAHWEQLKLRREKMKSLRKEQWPLVLPRDLPERLVRLKKLKASDIVDPWGQPYRVLFNPRLFMNPYDMGLVSRYTISSAGPDGKIGTRDDVVPPGQRLAISEQDLRKGSLLSLKAERALGVLVGNRIGEVYGVRGLGLIGHGSGGGSGGAYGSASGRLRGGRVSMPPRVRSLFPETLYWHPELITDRNGLATAEIDLADSITTWKLSALGSTTDGLLGRTALDIRVFQDFFVDLELPSVLTEGDRITVPVAVYNYLKTPQKIDLTLQRGGWFSLAGPASRAIELGPSQVGVRTFSIVVGKTGSHELTVVARTAGSRGAAAADAVRRGTLVKPDGVEQAVAFSGLLASREAHDMVIPEHALDGSSSLQLEIYPGSMSQTLSGLEGMLRRPHGCFEQTSSTTYPNVLILDYLRRTKQSKPALEKKAVALINTGYQRLISFEVPGGGFSWFGSAPANRVLTAYGLMEFHDMARVHPVDPALIKRTQRWLADQQRKDGSWGPDAQSINEGATNHYQQDPLRITAYLAHALQHSGYQGAALKKALAYVRRRAGKTTDPYTLALLGNLLTGERDRLARDLRRRLWRTRQQKGSKVFFPAARQTLTYGAGQSGQVETTALGALAFLSSGAARPRGFDGVMEGLAGSKDQFGSWHSTQATILSLRALLLHHQQSRSRPEGTVRVLVNDKEHSRVVLRRGEESAYKIDLGAHARPGRRRVALEFAGKGNLQYQLIGRYWVPRQLAVKKDGPPAALSISTRYDQTSVKPGDRVRLAVKVHNRGKLRVEMPLVSLALPPGFEVPEAALVGLVSRKEIQKVQRIGNRAVLYLSSLGSKKSLDFSLTLKSKHPLKVQARSSLIYEYYCPENRAESAPQLLTVL